MKKYYYRLIAFVVLVSTLGCINNSVVLNTADLFQDDVCRPAEGIADYDALVFESEGSEIYGQILKPDRAYGDHRPCVIFFHGFAGFARFDDIGQALCRAGCVVLIVHHRGAWGSQGKYSITHCIQDAVNLVEHVNSAAFRAKYHTAEDSVYLVGHSMGGNTALNATVQSAGVKGTILLAPCDIGTMTQQMSKAEMEAFLMDNGLEVLKTDGFEAVYRDLSEHAATYAFPNAAKQLKASSLLLIIGEMDTCISNDLLTTFYAEACQNKTLPVCQQISYKSKHGLMGVRVQISQAIADFILQTMHK